MENENNGNFYGNRNIWNSSKGFKEETREYWYRDQDRRASESVILNTARILRKVLEV